MHLDELDRSLLVLLLENPRAGLREYARTLRIARGTVAARFLRLQESGVITGFAPHVSPKAFGYALLAFVHLDLSQGYLDSVVADLAAMPEVIEAYTVTGDGDLLCHLVARDTEELEALIQGLVAIPGVRRTRSQVALTQRIRARTLPLVKSVRWSSAPGTAVKRQIRAGTTEGR